MSKKPRNDLVDRLVYLALRVVNMAVHSWGIGVASELAKFVGTVMFALDKRHRDRGMGNLRRSFPDLSEPRPEGVCGFEFVRRVRSHM